jgi:hypothetical protein
MQGVAAAYGKATTQILALKGRNYLTADFYFTCLILLRAIANPKKNYTFELSK